MTATIVLAALLISPAHAQNPPFTAYGTGLTAGDVVDVYVEGRYCDSATVDLSGTWVASIHTNDPCAPETGDVMTFLLNNLPTHETETWSAGGAPADIAHGTVLTLADRSFSPPPPASGGVLGVWSGGTIYQLLTYLGGQGCEFDSIWITSGGQFFAYIGGAPEFVNAGILAVFPDALMPAGTVMVVVCGHPSAVAGLPFSTYGTGLVQGDVVGIWADSTLCVTTTADASGNWGPVQLGETVGPCTFTNGDTIAFRLNDLRANQTETYAAGRRAADVANGTALTLLLQPWMQASLGHDWVEGGRLPPGEEFTLDIYESDGGALIGTFTRAADVGANVRWSADDIGIDLIPNMHLVLSGTGLDISTTMRSVSLGVWTGGAIDDFVAAATTVDAHSFYVEVGDDRIVYVIGAPAFVNQTFIDTFSPSFEATEPEVGVDGGGGTLYAPLYGSATAPVYIETPACSAEGQVLNSDAGLPIEGVTIGLYQWSEDFRDIDPVRPEADITDAEGRFLAPCDGIAPDLFPLVITLARSDWWGTAITGVLVPFGGASGLEVETSVCSSTRPTEDALILDELVGEGPTRLLTIEPRGNTVGYDFEAGTYVGGATGDFYLSRCGEPEFWANNWFSPWFQNGVLDLGDLGETALDGITPPADGYWKWGVPAVVGHTYVARTRGESATDHVIFRVLEVETEGIAITSRVLKKGWRRNRRGSLGPVG